MKRWGHEKTSPGRWLGIPYLFAGIRAARKLASRKKFDVVHAHWPYPNAPIAQAAAKACQAPLVTTCHGDEFAAARKRRWIKPLLKKSIENSNCIISDSCYTAGQVKELCQVESIVLPFGSSVYPKVGEAIPVNPRHRVLFTGRLIARKGVEVLLKAIPMVLARKDVDFVFVGDGGQKACLENTSRILNVNHRTHFLGDVSAERLQQEYDRCDLWVNPSIVDEKGNTQGLGLGSIEAYAHQKPVVASRVGGIPDAVINNHTGFLVEQNNPQDLAKAILKLVENPVLANEMGANGLEFAKRKFGWDRITNELIAIYLEAINVEQGIELNSSSEEIELLTAAAEASKIVRKAIDSGVPLPSSNPRKFEAVTS